MEPLIPQIGCFEYPENRERSVSIETTANKVEKVNLAQCDAQRNGSRFIKHSKTNSSLSKNRPLSADNADETAKTPSGQIFQESYNDNNMCPILVNLDCNQADSPFESQNEEFDLQSLKLNNSGQNKSDEEA